MANLALGIFLCAALITSLTSLVTSLIYYTHNDIS